MTEPTHIRKSLQPSSGLPDDFVFVVDHSYFGYDAQYMEGKALALIWEGHDADDNSAHRELISVGTGWETPDLGRTMVHVKGLEAPNASSIYGRILQWAIEEWKAGRPALLDLINERGDSTESEIWNGLIFHMARTLLHFGKNIEARERLMPDKFIGVDQEHVDLPSVSNPAVVHAPLPGSPATITILTRMAENSSDFQDFIESALDIPEVMENNALRAIVSDDSDDGFYATHRKG